PRGAGRKLEEYGSGINEKKKTFLSGKFPTTPIFARRVNSVTRHDVYCANGRFCGKKQALVGWQTRQVVARKKRGYANIKRRFLRCNSMTGQAVCTVTV